MSSQFKLNENQTDFTSQGKVKVTDLLNRLNEEKKSSDQFVGELIKKSIKLSIKSHLNKKPEVNFHIFRL